MRGPGRGHGGPGRGPGRDGSAWVRVAGPGPRRVPLGDQGGGGGEGQGLDSRRNQLAPSQPPSEAPALSHTSPPRVGFGPRGVREVARPEKFLPFTRWLRGTGSRSSVRELGCQDAEPGGTRVAHCNPFVGRSRETESAEGLVESGAELGLEML